MLKKLLGLFSKKRDYTIPKDGTIVKLLEHGQFSDTVHEGLVYHHDNSENVYVVCNNYMLCVITPERFKEMLI
jgi:hypothetical protein